MNTGLRLIFLALFGGCLAAPFAFIFLPAKFCEPVDENRAKQAHPAWIGVQTAKQLNDSLNQEFRWFEDHLGLRDPLIRSKNQIDFSLFGVSDKVYRGAGGWLYLKSQLDNYVPFLERQPLSYFDDRVRSTELIAQHLKRKGIELVVLSIPLKWTVYPEFLPPSAVQLPPLAERRYTYASRKLAESSAFRYIDALPELMRMKSETDAFFRTDYHWSEKAALDISRKLLTEVAAAAGRAVPAMRFNEEFHGEVRAGDSSRFLPIWHQPTEHLLSFVHKEPIPPQDAEPPYQMVFWNEGSDLLPPVLYLGDSFFWNILFAGFPRHFESFHMAHIQRESAVDILRNPPPGTRVVVIQYLELNFPLTHFRPIAPSETPAAAALIQRTGFYGDGWTAPRVVFEVQGRTSGIVRMNLWNPTPLVRTVKLISSSENKEILLQPSERVQIDVRTAPADFVKLKVSPEFIPKAAGTGDDSRSLGVYLTLEE